MELGKMQPQASVLKPDQRVRLSKWLAAEEDAKRDAWITEKACTAETPVPVTGRENWGLGRSNTRHAVGATINRKNVGELELKIEIAHPDFKFFVGGKPAVFPMSVPAGKEAAFEVRFPPPAKPGMLRDYVLVKSNDPIRASLSIYISRYIITKKDLKALFNKYKKELDKQD